MTHSGAWDSQRVLWPRREAERVGSLENAFISTLPPFLPSSGSAATVPLFFYSTAFSLFLLSGGGGGGRGPLSLSRPLSISAQITRAVYQSLSQQARGGMAWFVD